MLSESNTRKINTQDVDSYYKNFLASVTSSNLLSEKEIRSVNMWENKAYTESILESDILIFSPRFISRSMRSAPTSPIHLRTSLFYI